MVQSISAANTNLSALTNTTTVKDQAALDMDEEKTTASAATVSETESTEDDLATLLLELESSADGDTVEISDEAYSKYLALSASGTAGGAAQVIEQSAKSAESGSSAGAVSADEDNSNSTYNLSQYSEYELKQMMMNGDITRSAYESEMQSRA